jgi:hypothetical protein
VVSVIPGRSRIVHVYQSKRATRSVLSNATALPILLLVPSSGQSGNVEAQKAVTAGETARVGGGAVY